MLGTKCSGANCARHATHVPLDTLALREPGAEFERIYVLRKVAQQNALVLQQFEEKVRGRGRDWLLGARNELLGQGEEGRRVLEEKGQREDVGGIR